MKFMEWLRNLFTEGASPSHKILIEFGLVTVFCIAFLKKTAMAPEVQDIPPMWAAVMLGILGIRTVADIMQKKNGNGNGTNDTGQDANKKDPIGKI